MSGVAVIPLFGSCALCVSQRTTWPTYDSLLRVVRDLEAGSTRAVQTENASRLNACGGNPPVATGVILNVSGLCIPGFVMLGPTVPHL